MWQWIAVLIALLLALGLAIRKVFVLLKGRDAGCGCGGCAECPGRSQACKPDTEEQPTTPEETAS